MRLLYPDLTKGKQEKEDSIMGYESRVYVVEKKNHSYTSNEKKYAEVIAVFNMCKFNAFDGLFKTETDCYIYADDGNTEILKDRYGKPLTEASITDVITYLEKCQAEQEHYRRVAPLLALLKGFDITEWDNIVVLHYGY